jgi:hypothetical protein
MAAVESFPTSHNISDRLAWELQTPLSVRPRNFDAWPSETHYREDRIKMESVCKTCHSSPWIRGYFTRFDQAVLAYNNNYYNPAKEIIDALYEKNLINRENPLDEQIEIDMYELWHRDGRHARFGAAMMGPDHVNQGFHELKKRFMSIEEQAAQLNESGKPARTFRIRGGVVE